MTEDGWLFDESLRDLHLSAEGVVVLGIIRQNGSCVSPPDPDAVLHPGDTLVVYGQKHRVAEFSKRSDDETAREEAVEDHK